MLLVLLSAVFPLLLPFPTMWILLSLGGSGLLEKLGLSLLYAITMLLVVSLLNVAMSPM
jgi:hypothetical protein